ncbi:hypothetical protein KR059_008748 [Drosophila kikkawai]|nr:hypothetical protein KR059_008748 [Drosophila kikkawai]
MDESWWLAQLKALESKAQRLETLNGLNTAINKSAPSKQIARRVLAAPELYECAEIGGSDPAAPKDGVVSVVLELLDRCLHLMAPETSDVELPRVLNRGLTHTNPAVRSLVLNLLHRELLRQVHSGQIQQLPNNELLFLVLDELKQTETEASAVAIQILSIVLIQRLNDPGVQAKLVQLLQQNEIVRCRAYELAVNLSKSSASSLSYVEFILDAALSELDNDDVLLQASVMEILVPLAEQNHGLSYMERRRVFDVISNRVQRLEENPLDALLVPSIMKFFGKIAAVQPQKIIVGYSHMLVCLFEQLQSEDETILPTALDTLPNLAGTPQGKMLLHLNFQPAMERTMIKYGGYTKKLSAPIKVRLLNSLDVIYAMETMPPTKEIDNVLRGWYEAFAGGLQTNYIMDLINTPFPDLQLAALALLKTLCKYRWGVEALRNTGGAVEFLLSRQKDLHKDVKFLKWEILELLSVSPEFTPTETVRFTAYVNEGPYHIQADLNIATEPQGSA